MSNVKLSPGDPFLSIFRHKLYHGSINSMQKVEEAVADHNVIFSFAGTSGAAGSITTPYEDLHVNLEGHLNILEACRKKTNHTRLIFPSTRLVYGKPVTLPVNETHPINPQSFYAIHKNTAEYYYQLYSRHYQIDSVIFRISNPYGYNYNPEGLSYSVLNQFIYKAIQGKAIQVYGDGSQKRDYLHIDDLSRLLEISVYNEKLYGNIYNVGSGKGQSILEVARIITNHIPGSTFQQTEWPSLEKSIETGDYYSDLTKISEVSGWKPAIDLETGIISTAEAYKMHYSNEG